MANPKLIQAGLIALLFAFLVVSVLFLVYLYHWSEHDYDAVIHIFAWLGALAAIYGFGWGVFWYYMATADCEMELKRYKEKLDAFKGKKC